MIDVLLLYLFLVVFIIVLFYMILLYSDYDTSIIYRNNTSIGGTITLNSTPTMLAVAASNIEFTPNVNFRKKKINGKIKLVFSSSSQVNIDLSVRDAGNNNETVGDKTRFTIYNKTNFGTTTVYLIFETSSSTSGVHNIQVFGSANSSTDVKLHDAVIYYY